MRGVFSDVFNRSRGVRADANSWNPGGLFNATWVDTDGSPVFGSLTLSSSGIALTDLATQCAPLDGAFAGVSSFDMGARKKDVQFSSSTVKFDFYGTINCTGGTTGTNTPTMTMAATNGFTEIYTLAFARPASTNSVKITLSMHSTSSNPDNAGVARFDHVYIGNAGNVCTAETIAPVVTAPTDDVFAQTVCQ